MIKRCPLAKAKWPLVHGKRLWTRGYFLHKVAPGTDLLISQPAERVRHGIEKGDPHDCCISTTCSLVCPLGVLLYML